jgi:hypothetical protein
MPIYSLEINDFSCDDYTLIGIHTTEEDYRLAFLLNKHLGIQFKRANYDLDFVNQHQNSSYSIYDHVDGEFDNNWFLISNIFKTKSKPNITELFSESETKMFLIPEKKRVDFFVKIEGDYDMEFIVKTVEKINQIPEIITSYTIETNTLKSKEFLIF